MLFLLLRPLLLRALFLLPLRLLWLLQLWLRLRALFLLPLRPLLRTLLPLLNRRDSLLKMLLRYSLTRLVAVIPGSNRILLFCRTRIAFPRILPLIERQRCGAWGRAAIPLVPTASTLFPVAAPMITPTWWRVGTPVAKIHRRRAVVAYRNAQHKQRHILRPRQLPRPVVPAAHIPVVALVHPIQAVVKEVIRIHSRGVVDRIARYLDELRIRRHIDTDVDTGQSDADADADLGLG